MSKIGNFLEIFEADDMDGEPAGNIELLSLDLKTARNYAQSQFLHHGRNLDQELPDFDENFAFAQSKAQMGWTKRSNMPVIKTRDVRELQQRLRDGYLDVRTPWSTIHTGNPFPIGLTGSRASLWLKGGLKQYDGKSKDDLVQTQMVRVHGQSLMPVQRQIYFDKAIQSLARRGRAGVLDKLKSSILILGENLEIIDGHHRALQLWLIDPHLEIRAMIIDLPLGTLLPMAISYSDAIGNHRNA